MQIICIAIWFQAFLFHSYQLYTYMALSIPHTCNFKADLMCPLNRTLIKWTWKDDKEEVPHIP